MEIHLPNKQTVLPYDIYVLAMFKMSLHIMTTWICILLPVYSDHLPLYKHQYLVVFSCVEWPRVVLSKC